MVADSAHRAAAAVSAGVVSAVSAEGASAAVVRRDLSRSDLVIGDVPGDHDPALTVDDVL